ncbi:unnamed protein product [Dovyalis caffra]|uniref:Uncharacterized protein n=1 Tax=Dovyalis caffra TaxID=77055 RepID=A0AAV1SIU9_9ROSI|nr:unnamed protein product [Dovyalis caffra]
MAEEEGPPPGWQSLPPEPSGPPPGWQSIPPEPSLPPPPTPPPPPSGEPHHTYTYFYFQPSAIIYLPIESKIIPKSKWVKWFVGLADDCFRIQKESDMYSANAVKWSTLYWKVQCKTGDRHENLLEVLEVTFKSTNIDLAVRSLPVAPNRQRFHHGDAFLLVAMVDNLSRTVEAFWW